jgi:hypothetical protein
MKLILIHISPQRLIILRSRGKLGTAWEAAVAKPAVQSVEDARGYGSTELFDAVRVWTVRPLAAPALHMEKAQLGFVPIHFEGRGKPRTSNVWKGDT